MLGLASYISRLRAAGAALMPAALIVFGVTSPVPAAGESTARGASPRQTAGLLYRIDAGQVKTSWLQRLQMRARQILRAEKIGHGGGLYMDAAVSGEDFEDARTARDPWTGEPIGVFELNPRGSGRFAPAARDNIGKRLPIVLAGKILPVPRIACGRGQTGSHFSPEEARKIAGLRAPGVFPAPLVLAEERTIDFTQRRRE